MKRILCLLAVALAPIGAMGSPVLDPEPVDQERILEITDEVISEDFSEFIELSSANKVAVVEELREMLSAEELFDLRNSLEAFIAREAEEQLPDDGATLTGCGGTRVPYESRWMSYNPSNGQYDWIYRFKLGTSSPSCLQLLYQPAWWCWPMTPWGFAYQYKLYSKSGRWYCEVVLNPTKVCGMTCYCNGYFEMEYR